MTRTILIVDDDPARRAVLASRLAAACYAPRLAADAETAMKRARDERPDLILLDTEGPAPGGIALCARLRADPLTAAVPVLIATPSPADDGLAALRAGASELYRRPCDERLLFARIRSLLRDRATADQLSLRDLTMRELGFAEAPAGFEGPATVALLAATREEAETLRARLASTLSHRAIVLDREDAMALEPEGALPDAFLLAGGAASSAAGLPLIADLRARAATRHAAICVLLADPADETAAIALDIGASAVISAGALPEEIALRLDRQIAQKRAADRLRASVERGLRLAMTDPLTGLHNRRYALPHLARMVERARTATRGLAVLAIDIDRFKTVNDRHGHAAGDAVLVEIAERLRSNLRAVDLVARIGGEEFLVALPDTTAEAAHSTAERLRRRVGERPIALQGGPEIDVTLSIGVAVGAPRARSGDTAEGILARADRALMEAKAEGRNLVTMSRPAA
ncbi:MAG: diguanylate cyclase [Defluviimonas sp.]|uniref:diguanylate cyclase n=1 Tax=Albidovulum sp. TaxID=1872424 RepID=UPI001D4C3442|nr:diguanylate cyclase [Paracoccaceae bacterium]MCC0063708.1 diguanylate cyclase [Defluviimonas sp.]